MPEDPTLRDALFKTFHICVVYNVFVKCDIPLAALTVLFVYYPLHSGSVCLCQSVILKQGFTKSIISLTFGLIFYPFGLVLISITQLFFE